MTGLTTTLLLHTLMIAPGAQPYDAAYKTMQNQGRPLLVLVGADWCPACQTMKSHTLARLERSGKLQGVAFTIVNSDRDAELAGRIMRGSSIPQLVMYEPTDAGWRRTQLTGGQSEGQVEAFIAGAVARTKAKTTSDAAQASFDMTSAGGEQ